MAIPILDYDTDTVSYSVRPIILSKGPRLALAACVQINKSLDFLLNRPKIIAIQFMYT